MGYKPKIRWIIRATLQSSDAQTVCVDGVIDVPNCWTIDHLTNFMAKRLRRRGLFASVGSLVLSKERLLHIEVRSCVDEDEVKDEVVMSSNEQW